MNSVLAAPSISQTLLEDLARVAPKYERWTPQAYFELDGNYLLEYCRGRLEILPMPTITHQLIASRLYDAIRDVVPRDTGGLVLFAGTRVKINDETFREPDVIYIPREDAGFVHEEFTERAGLVAEVVSESNREHDLQTKRGEYAQAQIPEYWIVDPQEQRITVLKLQGGHYVPHGTFAGREQATSLILGRLRVDVSALFAVATP